MDADAPLPELVASSPTGRAPPRTRRELGLNALARRLAERA